MVGRLIARPRGELLPGAHGGVLAAIEPPVYEAPDTQRIGLNNAAPAQHQCDSDHHDQRRQRATQPTCASACHDPHRRRLELEWMSVRASSCFIAPWPSASLVVSSCHRVTGPSLAYGEPAESKPPGPCS